MYPPARARLGALSSRRAHNTMEDFRGETTTPGQRTRPEVQKMMKDDSTQGRTQRLKKRGGGGGGGTDME